MSENQRVAQQPKKPRVPRAAAKRSEAAATSGGNGQTRRRPFYNRPRKSTGKNQKEKRGQSAIPMHIIPLGGLGEVGKNITVYECQGDRLIVDCGLVFPDSDMFGIDLVIPDFTYVVQNKDSIKGVVITHGHEDHIGALPYLLKQVNLPIYATKLTIGLIKNKLEEHGLLGRTKLVEITPRHKFKLGCFTVEPIHVNHSIPDAVALAIECPAGIVIQTGDFKIDYTPLSDGPTDLATIAEYGKKGVLALLSDSTNAERPGFTATEHKVAQSFANLFRQADKQRIIIATFASNIYRVQQIIDLAVENGRKVAVSGRSMANNTKMALELGYLHAPDNVLIELDQINKYPPEKVVLITTGSQGEPLSALSRMASASHRNVRVGPGDFIIISATPIPGNEKMVTKVVNGLLRLGAQVIYESMYDVHVSGHACQEEQKLILTLANPQYFLPVHGEYKQLKKHAMTAESLGIPAKNIHIAEVGQDIILSTNELKTGESVPAGAVMVDGLGVGDVGNVVLRDRRHLSEDGLVIVVATVDSATGEVVAGPDLVSRGFVYVRESEELMEEARRLVSQCLDRCTEEHVRDWNSVKTRVRETLSSYIYRKTKRSPMILPVLMEV
ncbi:MAG: ribonuclease J [Candidatus Fournierella pullistercoris]|uniref:Ribonuclease J n=1 Tax=Candidatus Allofournierella pullistercoris TaxID=2838597 RepID=A0A948T1U8_9FIRM|nr:ribonuclease J [Candidatus Fournierella pullistercoris]